ncbi:hypothetical protein UT300007_17910 [Clostridium sp. CTA-7]
MCYNIDIFLRKAKVIMKNLIKLSNILITIAIVISLYGFYKIYEVRQHLPVGACPIEDNRPILYVGIFFMILSIIVSYIEDTKLKKKIKH